MILPGYIQKYREKLIPVLIGLHKVSLWTKEVTRKDILQKHNVYFSTFLFYFFIRRNIRHTTLKNKNHVQNNIRSLYILISHLKILTSYNVSRTYSPKNGGDTESKELHTHHPINDNIQDPHRKYRHFPRREQLVTSRTERVYERKYESKEQLLINKARLEDAKSKKNLSTA